MNRSENPGPRPGLAVLSYSRGIAGGAMKKSEGFPPDAKKLFNWYLLNVEAHIAQIDSAYHERFAIVQWTDGGALLEEYVLARFDAVSACFPFQGVQPEML